MLTELFGEIAVYGNMRTMRTILGVFLAVGAIWGQTKRVEFEVASVKSVEPSADPRV
jgi:hypothetical protein